MADQNQQYHQKLHDTLERYIRNEMSAEERAAFDSKLNQDDALKNELKFHQDLHRTLGNADEGMVRKKLAAAAEKWQEKNTPTQSRQLWPLRKLISVAAILVVAVGFLLWLNTQNDTQQFAGAFEAYPMVLNQRSAADTAHLSRMLTQAIQAYNKKEFNLAADNFNRLSDVDKSANSYQFYEAVSRLGNKEYDKAIDLFNKLLRENNHLLAEQSRWYLGVALNKSGQTKEADRIFKSIKPGEFNYEQIK